MNIPKLRFKGFNDEWKEEKIGNIFKNVSDKGYDYLPVLSVTQDNGVVYRNELKIDIKYNHSTLNTYKRVRIGQFIISLRSFQGGLELSDKLGIVSPAYTILDSVVNIDVNYWKYYFKTYNFIEHLKSTIIGIRDGKQINYSSFKDLKGNFPCLEEQQKIGALFAKLDNLIDLQAKKLELLKQLKQGLLQKLFPQNNHTTPQLRFKGFNEEWKEKKLGELGIIKAGNTFNEKEQGGLKGTPFYKVSDMNILGNDIYMKKANNYVTDHQIKLNRYNVIKEPSIIFAKVGAAIFLERKRIANNFIIDNNMMFFTPSKLLNIKFSLYLFNNIQLSRYAQIGSLPSYNASDISLIKILITNIQEQQKISSLLTNLDNLLTKAQEKLTLFKQVKKYLLQRMFI